MNKELEIKVLSKDLEGLKEKAISCGAIQIAHEIQTNTTISSSQYPLFDEGCYLRIRQVEDLLNGEKYNELTFKKKLRDTNIRENYEYTTRFNDVDAISQIFLNIKLDSFTTGKKERLSYRLLGARLDFDYWDNKTMPFPYLEIEVDSPDKLEELIVLLEIDRKDISLLSIAELKEKYMK